MAFFKVESAKQLAPVEPTTFQALGIKELIKLPLGLLDNVEPAARVAARVAEPRGQVRWLHDNGT